MAEESIEAPASVLGGATAPAATPADTAVKPPANAAPVQDTGREGVTAGEGGEEAARAAEKKDAPSKEAAKGAPEKYEDFKFPEGITVDPELMTEAQALFKESGLSQEAAQKYVDFHARALQKAGEAPYQLWEAKQKEWRTEVQNDPTIGSGKADKPLKAEAEARIAKVISEFGSPKFREALEYTGAGNHPEIIRTFDKIAKVLTEGGHRQGRGPVQKPATAAEAMYPHLPTAGT